MKQINVRRIHATLTNLNKHIKTYEQIQIIKYERVLTTRTTYSQNEQTQSNIYNISANIYIIF